MAIYELKSDGLVKLERTTFAKAQVRERNDLQRLLRQQIEVIATGTLIIAEEFGNWEDSRRRVDLLGIDKEGNVVVIELKRTEDGGHMELQAVRYAAMVSALTFEGAVEIYEKYLADLGGDEDARENILSFLEWEEADEEQFAQEVRIVLASAEFSKEITTSVLWLNEHGLDIRCVRLLPYLDGEKILLDVQQVIPLPEAEEYQVKIQRKSRLERVARTQSRDMTKYDVRLGKEELTGLPKRQAIFNLVRFLCTNGVDPERIRDSLSWKTTLLREAEGTLNSDEFEQVLLRQLKDEGKKPQPYRYFIADDELIHTNGRTYALTKMWGTQTERAMGLLVQNFSGTGISYRVSD